MKFEQRTREAMVEVMKMLDWECDLSLIHI